MCLFTSAYVCRSFKPGYLSVARHNPEKTFLVWVNEEDHCRVISMESGGNLRSVFQRLSRGLAQVSPGSRAKDNTSNEINYKYSYHES